MEHLIQSLWFCLLLTTCFPLCLAWVANRTTSMAHALNWTGLAWLVWVGFAGSVIGYQPNAYEQPLRYVALCVTCCAGVAVLGARRPGVGAWNFVVVGLLAVMLWPLLEQFVVGEQALGWLRLAFVGLTLAVICLNYLPTCMYVGALLFALGCVLEGLALLGWQREELPGWGFFGLAVWAAYFGWKWRTKSNRPVDELWFDFRNRIGFIWAQRIREHFNRSAENAGWPVFLSWQGLRSTDSPTTQEPFQEHKAEAMFSAMLKRFGPTETDTDSTNPAPSG